MVELSNLIVTPETSIRDVIVCIDRNAKGIAIVVNGERYLMDTLTDGDIRRAVLAGIDLDQPVSRLLKQLNEKGHPIAASADTPKSTLIRMMNEHSIRQIPLLDKEQKVVGLASLSDLVKEYELPLTAVIMAGGFGTRLRPLTEEMPKPMLPIGDRPLMEHIITQLRDSGIHRLNITTHYKPEKITEYFGDGHAFGVEIDYVPEDKPLGTAGALGLMPAPKETMLVMNGDILTQVNFRAMLEFHREHHADLTVAVRKYEVQVPYGVVECEGSFVQRMKEKPQINFLVNAGIYLLEPILHRYVTSGLHIDMTDLIQHALEDGLTVVSFPIVEYWLDIGQHADYEQANRDIQVGRCKI